MSKLIKWVTDDLAFLIQKHSYMYQVKENTETKIIIQENDSEDTYEITIKKVKN